MNINAREVLAALLMLPDDQRQRVLVAASSMHDILSAESLELEQDEQQQEKRRSRRYTLKEAKEIESAFKMDVEQYGYMTQTTRQKLMSKFGRTGNAIDNMFWEFVNDRNNWDDRMKNREMAENRK